MAKRFFQLLAKGSSASLKVHSSTTEINGAKSSSESSNRSKSKQRFCHCGIHKVVFWLSLHCRKFMLLPNKLLVISFYSGLRLLFSDSMSQVWNSVLQGKDSEGDIRAQKLQEYSEREEFLHLLFILTDYCITEIIYRVSHSIWYSYQW